MYQLVAPRLTVSEICVTLFHWIVMLQYGDVRWSSLLIDYGQPPAANSPTGKRCHNPPTVTYSILIGDGHRATRSGSAANPFAIVASLSNLEANQLAFGVVNRDLSSTPTKSL